MISKEKFAKRRKELEDIFSNINEGEKALVDKLLDEVIYLEGMMETLRQYPFFSVHPTKPQLQKSTAAAKQYKECSQSYMNAIRILLSLLKKIEEEEQNELLKRLEEFAI